MVSLFLSLSFTKPCRAGDLDQIKITFTDQGKRDTMAIRPMLEYNTL